MDEAKTNQPTLGTWDKLPNEELEKKPSIKFDIDKSVEATFLEDQPVELSGDNGAYYLFHVKEGNEEKVIMTSAWSLLRILKILAPLKDKTLVITKKMVSGKQHFEAKIKE
jgi:hypothetical protein|tara:strand:+ start:1274 stop:1606 length:333 start_codon:yes stop_codon:yes gene_type:complete